MASPAVVYTTAGLLLHSPPMILTRDVILAEIAKGRLAIEPLAPARLGLMIHVTSGFVAPGVNSRQVLEMSNVAGRPLALHAGVPVCQIVLQRCEGSAVYAGRFKVQESL